jgi:hypothetical protein
MQTAEKVRDAAFEAKDFLSDKFERGLKGLKVDTKNPPNVSRVRDNVLRGLKEKGVNTRINADGSINLSSRPNTIAVGAEAAGSFDKVQEMVQIINNWKDSSVDGIWTLRKALDKFRKNNGDFAGNEFLDDMMTDTRNVIRKELHTTVRGFEKMDKDWTEGMNFIKMMEKSLGIKKPKGTGVARLDELELPDIDENTLTKIGNLLNDRTSGNLELRKTIISEMDKILEKKTGVKSSLISELAGQRLSKEAAQGIAGKVGDRPGGRMTTTFLGAASLSGIGSAIGGLEGVIAGQVIGGAAGFLGDYVWETVRNMTVKNPVSIGKFFKKYGATETKVKEITDFISNVQEKTPARILESGATIGVLFDRLLENGNREGKEDLFTSLGRRSSPMQLRETPPAFDITPGGRRSSPTQLRETPPTMNQNILQR